MKKDNKAKVLKHWARVLPWLPNWRRALQLHSDGKLSSMRTRLSQLRMFAKFFGYKETPAAFRLDNLDHLIFSICQKSLPYCCLTAYLHSRTLTVRFTTVKSSFAALAFFWRHLTDTTLWVAYPKLRTDIKALQRGFWQDAEGSIALDWDLILDLISFMNNFEGYKYVSGDTLCKGGLLAFWYLCRSGESRKMQFDHVVQFSEAGVRRQRITFVEPKTGTRRRPDQFVTLDAHSSPHVCPLHDLKF